MHSDFRDAMRDAGLVAPDEIIADGEIHRFATRGDDDAGWYVLHANGTAFGAFGNWRTGEKRTWRADADRPLTPTEAKAITAQLHAARASRAERRQDAQDRAASIWDSAHDALADHPYLKAKGVQPHGARVHGDALVLPLYDTHGKLCSLQFISPEGTKRFLAGARTAGGLFEMGTDQIALDDPVLVCEGFATGASLHESTKLPTIIAFTASNLKAVAKAVRNKLPTTPIILCADDDYRTQGNPGLTAADDAAREIGGLVAVPDFGDERPRNASDFNDLGRLLGPGAVRECIARAHGPFVPIRALQVEGQNCGLRAQLDAGETVRVTRGSELRPTCVEWLWPEHLARGKLHIIAGAPGTGKTTIAISLAARITSGKLLPGGARCKAAGNVLIWSGEDDPEDTLLPRFLAMGGDSERLYFVRDVVSNGATRPFDPATDMPAMRHEADRIGDVALIVLDPVVNVVAGDSHKNSEVRRGLQPVVDLAAQLGAAALGVTHFSKGTAGRDPVERVTGSIAFGALARIVFGTAKRAEEQGGGRVLVRVKSNLGPDGGGFMYELGERMVRGYPDLTAAVVEWGEPLQGSARALLADAEVIDQPEERGGTTQAEEFLRQVLGAGSVESREVKRRAEAEGITPKCLRRARLSLGVRTERHGFGSELTSTWALPVVP